MHALACRGRRTCEPAGEQTASKQIRASDPALAPKPVSGTLPGLANEILSVGGALHRIDQPQQLFGVDEALHERDFFRAGDLQPLPLLDNVDELRGFEQGFMGAGVEPGIAAAKPLDM